MNTPYFGAFKERKKNMKMKTSIFAGLCSAALAVSIIPVSAEENTHLYGEASTDLIGLPLADIPDDGTLTPTPDDLVTSEYQEQVESEDSTSEVTAGSSSTAESSENLSESDSAISDSINSSSKTNLNTNSNNSNQNPTTGMAGGMAMIALMGGAVIISKRKNN